MKHNDIMVSIENHDLKLTNIDKVLFPDDSITKGDVITYYGQIAPLMLLYMKDHPVSMQRFPEGIYGESFFQKDAPTYFPEWITIEEIAKKEGGVTRYIVCQNKATLIYLANLACLTPHLWLSTTKKLDYPDKLIFDLDPPSTNFTIVANVALIIKKLLEELGLEPYVMTTGSRGVHVIIPLDQSLDFEGVKSFAQACASLVENENPTLVTTQLHKAKRGKRLFIDTLRNGFSATAVAPYSIRAHPKAPIATPIYWSELSQEGFNSQHYTIADIDFVKKRNPWKNLKVQSLKKATKELLKRLNI